MTATDTQGQIDAINRKLDIILEEIAVQRRQRQELADLKEDLMRVGRDLYDTAVVELEDVHDQFRTADVLHLGKKVLRNVDTITRMVEQLESLKDFLEDATPLARHAFADLLARMDDLDRKGYFAFLREMRTVADNVVTSFSADDVRHLGDNIVTILNTVKNLTQPDMLQAINNAVSVYKKLDIEVSEDVGLWTLIRELNTPEARRGLAFAVTFLKSLANQPQTGVPAAPIQRQQLTNGETQ